MSEEKFVSDRWWVSPFNYAPDVRGQFNLPPEVKVHDATLRDGEQTPGVVFRREEKVKIARMLDALGVDRIEAGMPAVSREDAEAIREIVDLGLAARVMGFCRAMPADVDRCAACGVWGVVLEIASGEPKLKHQFGWSEEQVIEKSIAAIERAKEHGLHVTFFPFDTTRARLPFLQRLLEAVMVKARPDSVAVVDTTGSILPSAMKHLVREVKKVVDVPVEIHAHNDFGLGTATTLAAVEAGAEVVQACVNGLGERAGNTSLEEVVLGLKLLYGYDLKLRLGELAHLSQEVAAMARLPLARNKPVVGELPFTREIGLGMETLRRAPLAVFPFLPDMVGRQMRIVLGKKSGKESIRVKLAELGQEASDGQVEAILARVKELGEAKKGCLDEEEFHEIVAEVRASS